VQDEFQPDQAGSDVFVAKFSPDAGGPIALDYSTYLGDTGSESAQGIAVDSAGSAYVTGETGSTAFPLQDQHEGDPADAADDIFVTKLDPDSGGAVTLAYSTYIGGGADDQGLSIAVDSAGAAYVTGYTDSTNFDTVDEFATDPADGAADAVVIKLAPGGSAVIDYSTYLAGGADEIGVDVAVDAAGAAYVTGDTASTDYPTVDEFQADPADGLEDVFVTKIDPHTGANVTLAYSTYLGGTDGGEFGQGIAVDTAGAAYATGWTQSSDYPSQDAFQGEPGDGALDAFVTKIGPHTGANVTLAYSTYLAGDAADQGSDIAVDSSGAAFVAGSTFSTDYPTEQPFQVNGDGSADGFVTKLAPDSGGPVAPEYSTYVGSTNFDFLGGIAVDSAGTAYVAGNTGGTDYPLQDEFQGAQGNTDGVVTTLSFPAPPSSDPDTDGDGVPDSSDACPTDPGPASNNGCPEDPRQIEPPVALDSVNIGVVDGVILIKRPGDADFIPLEGTAHIPLGTIIDARNGTVEIVSAKDFTGGTRVARFWDGVFEVQQEEKGEGLITVLELVPKFGCGKKSGITGRKKGGNGLWGSESGGGHKTKGNKGSGATRGTIWFVGDTCNGKTIGRVTEGKIKFRDFKKKKTITLKPGDKYVAG
jgi:hypothetical protein